MIAAHIHNQFQEARDMIYESEYILLAGHTDPDGDSLGSMIALASAIEDNLSKKVILYVPDPVPSSLQFLIKDTILSRKVQWYPDLIIGFDYGDFERLHLPQDIITGARMITFDHHPVSGQRGDIKIINMSFSSTSELVYEFLKALNWKISVHIAQCLLTGILTDTGALAHTNTSARTLKNTGELLYAYGKFNEGRQNSSPIKEIYSKTFANRSAKVLNVWGDLLKQITKDPEYNFVSLFLSFQEFKKYGIVLNDLAGVVSALNVIQDADFCVFAVEYEHERIKGSLRSEEFKGVDVSRIAQALGGGGHKYAAGFNIDGTMEQAQRKVSETIKKYFVEKV